MWKKLSEDQTRGHYPSTMELGTIFTYDVSKTYNFKGDELPKSYFGERKKLIHSVGTVGKVKFVSNGWHDYSGIFKGADHGIIRFSTGALPSKTQPMVTGFGLKFLRTGTESPSLVAMSKDFGVLG